MMIIPVKTKTPSMKFILVKIFYRDFVKRNAEVFKKADQLVIITDEHVWSLHENMFESNFTLPFKVYIVPNGEACKTFESYFDVQSFLLEENCSRNSALFALGGGAVGDLTGFVAATFMRGIPFYQIPTTILSA